MGDFIMKIKMTTLMLVLASLLFVLSGCGPSKDVISATDAIDAIGDVTINSGAAIETAGSAYDALSEKKKSNVTNYNTLVQARDQFDIISTMSVINAIGNVTINSGAAIETAEAVYNALPEKIQSGITNYNTLVQARDQFNILSAIAAINAIGDVSISSRSAIRTAEATYEKLTQTQRRSIDNYGKLQEAAKKFEFIEIGSYVNDDKYFVFSDENMTIELIDGPDAINDFGNYEALLKTIDEKLISINKKLGFPDSVYTEMLKTSLADGVQTRTFDNATVSWSFDPRAFGLSVMYKYIPNP